MYVGHALLGFTLGALAAAGLGARRSRALLVGAFAGGFALVPDVDMARTAYVVVTAGSLDVFPTTEHVWTRSWVVHRSITHSLVVGAAAATLAGLVAAGLARRRSGRSGRRAFAGAAGIAAALLVLVPPPGVTAALVTMGLYLAAATGLALLGVRRGLPAKWVGAAAGVGLLSHPVGDVFMGRPPVFLYPLRSAPPIETLVLAPDPTVNLVGLFGIELCLGWAALVTYARLSGRALVPNLRPHALLGVGFAGAVAFIRPPTLDVAYHFAVGALATGTVLGYAPDLLRGERAGRALRGTATALAGVTAAVLGYLVAYLVYAPS